jgi:hypothetical protein
MEAHALRAGIPKAGFTPCLRADNSAWHTLLEAVFALYFHHKGAFFASQKTGLSAPILRCYHR